jgi:hypothetical protein
MYGEGILLITHQQKEKDMGFNKGDRVRVTTKNDVKLVGTVSATLSDQVFVRLDTGDEVPFFHSELTLFDAGREALIELAETLDKARLQANAIVATQSQYGVYGQISDALAETLILIEGGYETEAYQYLLDGNTVREALAAVEGK